MNISLVKQTYYLNSESDSTEQSWSKVNLTKAK